MAKALFFDIDGTLFDSKSDAEEVPEGVVRELRRLQAEGHRLFVCTGRPRLLIPQELDDFGFDGFVLANGGHVEIEGQTVYQELMGLELATAVADLLADLGFEYTINSAHHIFLPRDCWVMRNFFADMEWCFTFDYDRDEALGRAIKLECFPSAADRERIRAAMEREIGPEVTFNDNGTRGTLELYSARLSKATGIAMALEHFGIARKDSYGFGDGTNDLPMIRACGTGVAMGNACDELKREADLVCGDVSERGLELALQELFPA